MLNPRRANSPEMRVSTPNLFSTSTDRMWCCGSPFTRVASPGDSAPSSRPSGHSSAPSLPLSIRVVRGIEDDLVVRVARRHHRVHLLPIVGAEVDGDRPVAGLGPPAARRPHPHAPATRPPGPLPVVRQVGRQVHLAVAPLVEQLLPLADHAEVRVVE